MMDLVLSAAAVVNINFLIVIGCSKEIVFVALMRTVFLETGTRRYLVVKSSYLYFGPKNIFRYSRKILRQTATDTYI